MYVHSESFCVSFELNKTENEKNKKKIKNRNKLKT